MHHSYLLLGSNQGERAGLLHAADSAIGALGRVFRRSTVYETAAWGLEDQPAFLNQALLLETELGPEALLERLLGIERALGRLRDVPWGPRTIDIDILLFDDRVLHLPHLHLPHPRLHLRRFALAPLAEIAGNIIHPALGKSVSELLILCPDPLAAVPVQPA